MLRLANPNQRRVSVEVHGLDDRNALPGSVVGLELAPLSARALSARELEEGADGLTGALGNGVGKWQLAVTADAPLTVMSLLDTPTGHLANLSRAAAHSDGRCWPATDLTGADRSIGQYLSAPIQEDASPGLIAAIVDSEGVRAIASAGVRKAGAAGAFQETDVIHIGSNAKAMTAVMLATLVAEGVFAAGWETTVAEVFPELRDEIHADYRGVTLWQLVSMRGGVKRDATNWSAHRNLGIVDRRYALLRDNLADPPAVAAGVHLYSNLAYLVAGAMAEKRTGRSWETLMRQRVFQPLGMASAGFGPPGTLGEVDQPWGHRRDPATGNWVPNQLDNPAALGPAGAVHLTIVDWAKFMALWLPAKPPAIPDRLALDRLITPIVGNYAGGWYVVQRGWANGKAMNHAGSNTNWFTLLWVAPGIDRAYVVGANSAEADLNVTFGQLDAIIGQLINHSP